MNAFVPESRRTLQLRVGLSIAIALANLGNTDAGVVDMVAPFRVP